MTSTRPTQRLANLVAIAVIVLAPLLLLGDCLLGDETFLPFDPAQFKPASIAADPSALAEVRRQGSNPDVTEVPLLVVPELQLAQAEIADGRFPGWNPYARFGGPLFANGLAGMVYPPNWAMLLSADPAHALGIAAFFSFVVAGVLMFAFLRACQLSVFAALFGALAFALSGTLTANAHFYMRMNALIWLPGILLAFLRIERTNGYERIPGLLGLGVCVAMTWLAGFPPFAIAASAFAGLYGASLFLREWHRGGAGTALRFGAWLAAGTALGVALAAVQLAPLLAYFPESSRDLSPPLNTIAAGAFDPMGLLGYVLPTAFGEPDPLAGGPPYERSPLSFALFSRTNWVDDAALGEGAGFTIFPPTFNFTEYAVFVGALPLLLALVGSLSRIARPRIAMLSIFGVLALLAMAPSALAPIYEIPGLLKTPSRFVGPLVVAVVTLAAIGFDTCLRRDAHRVTYAAAGVGAAIATTCVVFALVAGGWDIAATIGENYAHLANGSDPRAMAISYLGEATIERGLARLTDNLWQAAAHFAIAAALLSAWTFFRSAGKPVRLGFACLVIGIASAELLTFAGTAMFTRTRPVGTDTEIQSFLRDRDKAAIDRGGIMVGRASRAPREPVDLPSGLLFPDRIRDVNAYAFSDPWSHLPFRELYGPGHLMRSIWPRSFPDDERLERPFFDLIGLHYLLATEELEHAGTPVGPELRRGDESFRIYERPNALPRAFVVGRTRELPDDASVITALLDPSLDPRAAVLVTPDAGARLPVVRSGGDGEAPREVRFARDLPNEMLITVSPGSPGYLVVSDACLDGWDCTVNGAETDIVRGNLFMRVVPLDSHGAEVRFRYTPPALETGLTLTTLALLTALTITVVYILSRRRLHRVETSM